VKSENFEMLRQRWPELAALGGFAEAYAHADPASALVKLRLFAENMTKDIYRDLRLPKPDQSTFVDLLKNPSFAAITPKVVLDKLHALRIHGNKAAHGDQAHSRNALWLLQEAYDLARWLYIQYGNGTIASILPFRTPKADATGVTIVQGRERRNILEKLAAQETQMEALLGELDVARKAAATAEKKADELQALAASANASANALEFDEATTRSRLIDSLLASAGWNVAAGEESTAQVGKEIEVQHQPTESGLGYADYVLWDDNGNPLAVIEAKKTAVDPERGRHQAKLYADGFEKMHGHRPVIFYTNGFDIWIWDDAQGFPPRKLFGFYSKDSLQYLANFQRIERKPLNTIEINKLIVNRLYQIEAIKRISERFSNKHRKALTRLKDDLFGPGRPKTIFRIFDHWGNFERFEMGYRPAEPTQSKSIMQLVFEERLVLAESALQKSELPIFDLAIGLIAADIEALPEESISVREKWKEKRSLSVPSTLKAFGPATVVMLRQQIAPLMQWRNIRGFNDAYALDLLVARMQVAVLRGSGQPADLKVELMDRVASLQMHLNPVREKADVIKRVKSDAFWDALTVKALDEVRKPLREIMHHRERPGGSPLPPKIVDITEDEAGLQYKRRSTSLRTVDVKAYQEVVEAELKRHFDSDPTLKKIRAGEPVSEADIQALVSMILTQSPNASRDVLAEFFRSVAAPLDFAIRSIVGMEPTAVAHRFSEFARKHPALTAKQTRFLGLLQNHIARYGSITVDRLYEQPFTVVDADGLDGVFECEDEVDDLIQVIKTFGPSVGGQPDHGNPNERSEKKWSREN
jgi:type I site-specific restriction endonuclease